MELYCKRLGLSFTAPPCENKPLPKPKQIFVQSQVKNQTDNIWTRRASEKKAHEEKVHEEKVHEEKAPKSSDTGWKTVAKKSTRVKSSRTKSSSSKKSTRVKSSSSKKSRRKDVLCNSVGTGKPCRHGTNCRFQHVHECHTRGQVVLRVPGRLASQAMKHAISTGMKNFRVEIIN